MADDWVAHEMERIRRDRGWRDAELSESQMARLRAAAELQREEDVAFRIAMEEISAISEHRHAVEAGLTTEPPPERTDRDVIHDYYVAAWKRRRRREELGL